MRSFITLILGVNFLPLIISYSNPLSAQEPWEFYLAFEDAIGSKDTIWYVMHPDGTGILDPDLGEVLVDLEMDQLNGWIYNWGPSEGFKRVVFPFGAYNGFELYCNNYVLPVTISYDSSLFNSPILLDAIGYVITSASMSNQFLHEPDADPFNMLVTNECVLPFFNFGGSEHFPIIVELYAGPLLTFGVEKPNLAFTLFPNPSSTFTTIQSPSIIHELVLRNALGQEVRRIKPFSERIEMDLNGLGGGIYLVEVITEEGPGVQKLVVE